MKQTLVIAVLLMATMTAGPVARRSDASRTTAAPADFQFADVGELVLGNGFRILVVQDTRVPRVAASLWYRVGALQEPMGEHGSTHFLEHAMHQGTTTIGTSNFDAERPILREIHEVEQQLLELRNRERNRLRERGIFFDELAWPSMPEIDQLRTRLYSLEDRAAQYRDYWAEYNWYRRYGGLARHTDPVPANTGNEQMDIDVDFPKQNIELFFRIEADRMVNAVFRGWEAHRFVVLEQALTSRWSRPETRFVDALQGVSGAIHPIHTSNPWGHLRDFAYFNREQMLEMYDRYMVPNNATLALVGDISLAEARPLAEKYFGLIPRGAEPPARMDLEVETPPGGAVRLDWSEPLSPRVIVRFRIPGVGHADRPVFDTIATLAASRLNRECAIAKGLGADVDANASRSGSPNMFEFTASARRDDDLPALESCLLQVADDFRRAPVDAAALDLTRKALRLEWARLRADRDQLAFTLASFQTLDQWQTLQRHMEGRLNATADDIQRAGRRYFVTANRIIATTRNSPVVDNRSTH